MQEARPHFHPRNTQSETYGTKLEPGDVIKSGDVYDRTDGTWAPCNANLVGTRAVADSGMIIVRRLPVATFVARSQS